MASVRVTFESGDTGRAAVQAASEAFKAGAQELFGRMQDSFAEDAWQWPNETRRQNGRTVGSPRNIIDTANLRQTGLWGLESPFSARMVWSASYAAAVHEGARLRNGTFLPPRPWTKAVTGEERVSGITPYPIEERVGSLWFRYMRQRGN